MAEQQIDWQTLVTGRDGTPLNYIFQNEQGAQAVIHLRGPQDSIQFHQKGSGLEVRQHSKDRSASYGITLNNNVTAAALRSFLRQDPTQQGGAYKLFCKTESLVEEEKRLKDPTFARTDWEPLVTGREGQGVCYHFKSDKDLPAIVRLEGQNESIQVRQTGNSFQIQKLPLTLGGKKETHILKGGVTLDAFKVIASREPVHESGRLTVKCRPEDAQVARIPPPNAGLARSPVKPNASRVPTFA